MMGQGFGDEIGNALIRAMVLIFLTDCGVAIGLYFTFGWILKHIAIHWK